MQKKTLKVSFTPYLAAKAHDGSQEREGWKGTQERRAVPRWLIVPAQYSGGRTPGRMICSHPEYTLDPKTGSNWSITLRLKMRLYWSVYHARPEMRSSLCWSRRGPILLDWRLNMASADRRMCSEPCGETPWGLTRSTWRMCSKTQLLRY